MCSVFNLTVGHFGPYRGRHYRGARPAARSQFLRSCFDGSYDSAAAGAGSDILGTDILDAALDCVVSVATARQISNALRTQESQTQTCPEVPWGGRTSPFCRDQQIGNGSD